MFSSIAKNIFLEAHCHVLHHMKHRKGIDGSRMEAKDKEYDKSMDMAAGQLSQLNDCLARIGFEKETVKTTDFNVKTDYDSRKGRQRNFQRVFSGFVCSYQLKLSIDFDMKKLSRALAAIADC